METVNENPPPTSPPFPGAAEARPKLTRATDDKVVSGLSGGLGRYFGVDPIVFRIAFVVMALAGGSGVLLYLVGWLLIPDDRGGSALPRVGKERNQKLVAAVLAGAGVLILANQLTDRHGGDVPVGLVLVGIGGLVLWSRRTQDGPGGTPPSPPAPPPGPSPSSSEPPMASTETGYGEPVAEPAPAGEPTAELPPFRPVTPDAGPPAAATPDAKPRSALVTVTLSSLAILAGGLALFGVSATTGLALALLLTGAALMVGAWRGRARLLIPVGLLLAVALAAASLIDVPVRGGSGEITYHPVAVDDVRSPYRLAAGHLVLDLRDLDLQGRTVTVVASVAAGNLEVLVPDGVGMDVAAHVGAGNLRVLGRVADGLDVERPVTEAGPDGSGRIVLRARTGVGAVEVRRASA
jgi:phage shock protein PspC (stress-responsive transcriptional regulator)